MNTRQLAEMEVNRKRIRTEDLISCLDETQHTNAGGASKARSRTEDGDRRQWQI